MIKKKRLTFVTINVNIFLIFFDDVYKGEKVSDREKLFIERGSNSELFEKGTISQEVIIVKRRAGL